MKMTNFYQYNVLFRKISFQDGLYDIFPPLADFVEIRV